MKKICMLLCVCLVALFLGGSYADIKNQPTTSLLTHYGWNNRSQVIVSSYVIGSTFYIKETGSHRHGYYWLDPNSHIKYCACGLRQTPNTSMR